MEIIQTAASFLIPAAGLDDIYEAIKNIASFFGIFAVTGPVNVFCFWLMVLTQNIWNFFVSTAAGMFDGGLIGLGGHTFWVQAVYRIQDFQNVAAGAYTFATAVGLYESITSEMRIDIIKVALFFVRLFIGVSVLKNFTQLVRKLIEAGNWFVGIQPAPSGSSVFPEGTYDAAIEASGAWPFLLLLVTLIAFFTIVFSAFGLVYTGWRLVFRLFLTAIPGIFAVAAFPIRSDGTLKNFIWNMIQNVLSVWMFLCILRVGTQFLPYAASYAPAFLDENVRAIFYVFEGMFAATLVTGMTAQADTFVSLGLGLRKGW